MANAKVEVAVQVAQRWILARLRNHRFFSLAELNVAIRRLLDELNMRVMRGYGASRADLFATPDRPNLQPLLNRPGFTGGQNSRRIARYGTESKEDLEAIFTRVPRTCGQVGYGAPR